MRFVLARHGESELSVRGILNGDPSVPCGLTAVGVEQARVLGAALADEPFDLCVTSQLQRTHETADEALRGREVPRVVMGELNDPRYGAFEGAQLEAFRTWAERGSSAASPGEGGESRFEIVTRYARAFRLLLARPEESILVVAHSLPIAYALAARDGVAPAPRVPLAAYATPYPFDGAELELVAGALERWSASPTW